MVRLRLTRRNSAAMGSFTARGDHAEPVTAAECWTSEQRLSEEGQEKDEWTKL